MIRTHEAGTLRVEHAGERVVLAGWVARRRDHGGVMFIDLRDASGVVQVLVRDLEDEATHHLRAEFCIRVTGEVRRRATQPASTTCSPACSARRVPASWVRIIVPPAFPSATL